MNGHKKTTTRHIQCVVHVFCVLSLSSSYRLLISTSFPVKWLCWMDWIRVWFILHDYFHRQCYGGRLPTLSLSHPVSFSISFSHADNIFELIFSALQSTQTTDIYFLRSKWNEFGNWKEYIRCYTKSIITHSQLCCLFCVVKLVIYQRIYMC